MTIEPLVRTDPTLHITPYGEDEIFVRRGSRSQYSRVIRDTGRRRLLAALTSELAVPCEVGQLRTRYPDREADVEEILEMLQREGVVLPEPQERPNVTGPVRLLGSGLTAATLAELLRRIGTAPVELYWEGDGAPSGAEAVGDLLDMDLEAVFDGAGLVVVAAEGLRPALSHLANTIAAELGAPWLNIAVDGSELLIGPLVVPGLTACFNCFEVTDEGGRQHRYDFLIYKDRLRAGDTLEVAAPQAYLAASWASIAIDQWLRTGGGFLVDRVLRVDTERLEVIGQRVFQLPRCPVCMRTRPDLRHTFL